MKNATRTQLENLEHDVMNMMSTTMYSILDNGDRPDKRINAIIGLNDMMKSTLQKLDKITLSIPESL
jgi:hypothetical protein